jgi:hypothetical protein
VLLARVHPLPLVLVLLQLLSLLLLPQPARGCVVILLSF